MCEKLRIRKNNKSRFIEMFGDPVTNSKGLVTKKGSDFFTLKNGKLIIQKSLDELETLNKALMQKYFGGN